MAQATLAAPLAAESPVGQIQRGDPLARALSHWGLGPWTVTLGVAAYGAAYALALPALFGHLWTAGGVTGALDDWPNLVIILLMAPLTIGYYAWQPAIIQATYAGIAARAGRNALAAKFAQALTRPLGWPAWLWAALLASTLECWIWIHDQLAAYGLQWTNANPLMMVTFVPLRFLSFYVLMFIIARQAVVLVGLNRFFGRFTTEIQPLHPDHAGGLRVLGDYVFTNGLLIAVVGLYFGMEILRVRAYRTPLTVEFYVQLAVYLAAAPAISLLPLLSVHARMREAREKLLAEIAEQFDLEYRSLLDGLRRDELKLDEVERLEAIQKIYHIAQSSPEWPFDLGIVSRIGAAILLPLLLPLVVNLLDVLLTR